MTIEDTRKGNHITLLKEANRYLIMQCIIKYAPLSTEDIVKRTNLSRPTVLGVIRELQEERLIIHDGFSESIGGRAANLWALNGEDHFAVGIDFEFPKVRMTLANMKRQIRASQTLVFSQDVNRDTLLTELFDKLNTFIDDSGIARKSIRGIGVGLPGVIDTVKGMSLSIERIHGWKNVRFQEELEKCTGLQVYIKNDVHLMGLVEKRLYLGDEIKDFIYVGFRSGIGCIVYQKDRPMRGEKGNAGFIGHSTLNPNGPVCCCGSRGCLDVYAGKMSIVQNYVQLCTEQGTVLTETPDFDDLLALAASGDALAAKVMRDAGFYLGVALSNLIKIVEIPRVVIGGCPALKDSVLLEAAEASMKQYLTDSLSMQVSLSCGAMPEEKFALGGCLLVFDHLLEKPKLNLSSI